MRIQLRTWTLNCHSPLGGARVSRDGPQNQVHRRSDRAPEHAPPQFARGLCSDARNPGTTAQPSPDRPWCVLSCPPAAGRELGASRTRAAPHPDPIDAPFTGQTADQKPRLGASREPKSAGRPPRPEWPASQTKTAHISAGGFRSRFGPIGTGRGTCQKGPVRVARAAGGADVCGFARTYVGLQDRQAVPDPGGMITVCSLGDNRTFVQTMF